MKINYYILFFLLLICVSLAMSQDKITFLSFDSLEVTADIYLVDESYPYILLFHEENSSRGEYNETAFKLAKLGFNCLAVDLRSGGESNFVKNETAALAREKGFPNQLADAEKDILAAIDYAFYKNYKQVVLFGSSYSASLCIKAGKSNPKVKAIIAFSPGEFFKPAFEIKEELIGFKKPIFVASSKREYSYILEMFTYVPNTYKTIFKPHGGPGDHGSKSLWSECNENKEYWLSLLLYFKNIKSKY